MAAQHVLLEKEISRLRCIRAERAPEVRINKCLAVSIFISIVTSLIAQCAPHAGLAFTDTPVLYMKLLLQVCMLQNPLKT